MARKLRIIRQKSLEDSGFSANAAGRFVNKDGRPNVRHRNEHFLHNFSWYHTMINLSSGMFILYLILGYIGVNVCFALIYYIIGVGHLTGIDQSTPLNEFIDVFFFSSQTFTTVGYGRIAPVGFFASLVSTFEAFLGLLAFAIATGLFYGRFSRPRAYLKFSQNALIAPYQGGTALMFRLAPFKNNILTEAEVLANAAIEVTEDGVPNTKFYRLTLELSKIVIFSLNWTLVHKIDENSPFFGFTEEDFTGKDTGIEIIVQFSGFDEGFANTVMQRTSYVNSEIVYGAKFDKMYEGNQYRQTTVLELAKLNHYTPVPLPEAAPAATNPADES